MDVDKIKGGEVEQGKILYIGNVTKRKGVEMLAEAVKGLDVILHIIGDGYLLPKIKGNNIVKHGKVEYDELLKHLSNAEMLVVPSLWPEPFGRVAVEGMAAGLPVIISSIGGLPEVVGDAGVVMKGIGVDELRSKIKALHQDEKLRIRMGEKGKERSRIFHPDNIAGQMISVYEEILGSK